MQRSVYLLAEIAARDGRSSSSLLLLLLLDEAFRRTYGLRVPSGCCQIVNDGGEELRAVPGRSRPRRDPAAEDEVRCDGARGERTRRGEAAEEKLRRHLRSPRKASHCTVNYKRLSQRKIRALTHVTWHCCCWMKSKHGNFS